MKVFKLDNMVRGWFVGDFDPSAYKGDFEVGVRNYHKGDEEPPHYHKRAKELTLILNGKVEMAGMELGHGDIICLDEFDVSGFKCLEDCILVIVKTKSIKGDKYDEHSDPHGGERQ